jgi:hypothetical protein
VFDADEPQTGRHERRIGIGVQDQTLPLVSGLGPQSAIVERIGDETAQIRVHPSRLAEEDAALGRDRRGTVEHVLQRGKARSPRMTALYDQHEPQNSLQR